MPHSVRARRSPRADGRTAADADVLATRVMDSLRRLVHALHVGTRASERAIGLSSAQLFVLRQLHATSEEQSLNDVAKRTRTTPSSVSEVVARLVKGGLVMRAPSARDRRRAVLTLTPSGEQLVAAAPETIQDRLLTGFGRLDPVSQARLADALEAWLVSSDLADVTATFFFESEGGTT